MSTLPEILADYLKLRRSLGYKLVADERLLGQFLDFLAEREEPTITTELAISWASQPSGTGPGWIAQRLSMVRTFAVFVASIDPTTQVPPAGCLPVGGPRRAVPYLYTDAEVEAIMAAARSLPTPLLAHTYEALIGLLAVTGMRIGEALSLARGDVLFDHACVQVIDGKLGKSREVPLAPSSVDALRRFAAHRDELAPKPRQDSFFCSTVGTRLVYARVRQTFSELCHRTGVVATSSRCRPRLHDLRHRYAVLTLVSWQQEGSDVAALLPLLSTVLGHINPANTYWYLSSTPELLAPIAARLENTFEVDQ